MAKILVIEDNIDTQHLLQRALIPIHEIKIAADLKTAWSYLKTEPWDLAILDRGLPDGDGIDLCVELKNLSLHPQLSILMLTGHSDLEDKIKGLTAGADDYVIKPFEPRELMARIDALQRRRSPANGDFKSIIVLEDLVINVETHTVHINVGEKPVTLDLTPIEFKILLTLAKDYGHKIDRTQLVKTVWNNVALSARNIDTHVCHLRKKLVNSHVEIKNCRGQGYSLMKSVFAEPPPATKPLTSLPFVKKV